MDKALEAAFGVRGPVLPPERVKEFERLYSQTSPAEREALYAVARYAYTGEGEILDIGTAAGGSTYCLAAGLLDSGISDKVGRVHGFDIFEGFSLKVFADRLEREGHRFQTDLEFFDWQVRDVASAVVRTKADLISNPEVLKPARQIEIAHIDAAKNLPLWKAIFGAIAPAVISEKTIWIFQDFEQVGQPWQIYGLNCLMPFGSFIGGAPYGTLYFRFNEQIPNQTIRKIVEDAFTLDEKLEGVDAIYRVVARDFPHLFLGKITLDDLRTATQAFCHDMAGDISGAGELVRRLSPAFHGHPGMKARIARFNS